MREQKSIYEMTDRELRIYRRELRRKIALRRRVVSLIATVCLIAVCVISYHSLNTSANTGSGDVSYKYYTHITVKYCDTLWDIADDYIDYDHYANKQAYIREVCSINRLEDADDLIAGKSIVVPYYSTKYVK